MPFRRQKSIDDLSDEELARHFEEKEEELHRLGVSIAHEQDSLGMARKDIHLGLGESMKEEEELKKLVDAVRFELEYRAHVRDVLSRAGRSNDRSPKKRSRAA